MTSRKPGSPILTGIAILATALAGAAATFALTRYVRKERPPQIDRVVDKGMEEIPEGQGKGIEDPPLVSAEQAKMRDNETVIGILHGQTAIAIRKSSMAAYSGHIQRFAAIGPTPLTVIHCSRSNCTRVMASAPDDLQVVGYDHQVDEMILSLHGRQQRLSKTGEQRHTETTWKEWKAAHPGTLVMDLDAANLQKFAERKQQSNKQQSDKQQSDKQQSDKQQSDKQKSGDVN